MLNDILERAFQEQFSRKVKNVDSENINEEFIVLISKKNPLSISKENKKPGEAFPYSNISNS